MSQEVLETEAVIIDSIIMLSNRVVYVVELLDLLASLKEMGHEATDVAMALHTLGSTGIPVGTCRASRRRTV